MLRSGWLVVVCVGVGLGCRPAAPSPTAPAPTAPAEHPRRIVSLAPATTELLFALGLGESVVAGTELDNYPAEARRLPRIGGFRPESINLEAVLGHTPDLVIATAVYHQRIAAALTQSGIPVLEVESKTIEQTLETLTVLGRRTGRADKAAELVADFRTRWSAVEARTAMVPVEKRPRVLFILTDDPLMTAGPNSFIGQVLTAAGGVNVFADATTDYPRVGDETVVARGADVLVCPDHGGTGVPERIRKRPGWNTLAAVRANTIVSVDEDTISRPGLRLIAALEALATALAVHARPN